MYLELDIEELLEIFESNLLDTNRGYNYYVDWNNITGLSNYLVEIHAMDVLIRCEDFHTVFCDLLTKLPSVIEVFPFLFALSKIERYGVVNSDSLKIIGSELDGDDYNTYSFNSNIFRTNICDETIESYYEFFENMGLKNLFENLLEKSVYDYITGVLVGLDSNGRKNRGGKAFELACEPIIREICERHGINVITQKKFSYLSDKYGTLVNDVIENRKADFILINEESMKCMNIEVNFFNGGGSKPEEIINSYIQRQGALSDANIEFCLITDGKCWNGTTNQLRVGFNNLKFIMNYNMAKQGMLEEMIVKELL